MRTSWIVIVLLFAGLYAQAGDVGLAFGGVLKEERQCRLIENRHGKIGRCLQKMALSVADLPVTRIPTMVLKEAARPWGPVCRNLTIVLSFFDDFVKKRFSKLRSF